MPSCSPSTPIPHLSLHEVPAQCSFSIMPVPKHRRLIFALGAVVGTVGCAAPRGTTPTGPTQADRLMRVYPELASGRFAVIADFEDPRHMDLIRLISVSNDARCVLDSKGGRRETGRQCLRFAAGSADDTVVVANAPEGQWHLKRDWRAYDLLLLSVESPQAGLDLGLTIASGPAEARISAQTSMRLAKGWNVLRLDLAEIGELITLDDVQEIRIGVNTAHRAVAQRPSQIRLDDVVLSGNREELFGNSRDTSGKLYVQRVGRRWNIGAGGHFELTFSNGQITHWYNLVSDPNRLRNLLQGNALGPTPVVVDESGKMGDVPPSGRSVAAGQRLVEMSAVRAVVASEWLFVDESNPTTVDRPLHRWVYTLYPTGQVYVAVETTSRTPTGILPAMGLAITLSSSDEGHWSVKTGGTLADGAPVFPAGSFLARSSAADSALLWVLDRPSAETRIIEERDASTKSLSLVIHDETVQERVRRWSGHLFLSRSQGFSDAEGASRAQGYAAPPALGLELGSFAADPAGVSRSRSLNSSEGCHVLQPEQGRVRVVVPASAIFSPAFRVIDVSGADCWVYVDHLVLSPIARNADDELIFQLPSAGSKAMLVEVLSRRPTNPSP